MQLLPESLFTVNHLQTVSESSGGCLPNVCFMPNWSQAYLHSSAAGAHALTPSVSCSSMRWSYDTNVPPYLLQSPTYPPKYLHVVHYFHPSQLERTSANRNKNLRLREREREESSRVAVEPGSALTCFRTEQRNTYTNNERKDGSSVAYSYSVNDTTTKRCCGVIQLFHSVRKAKLYQYSLLAAVLQSPRCWPDLLHMIFRTHISGTDMELFVTTKPRKEKGP